MNWENLPKKINRNCPLCGTELNENNLHILKEMSNGHLMTYSVCANCHVGMVAKVSISPSGLMGVGILTDMNKEELINFSQNKISVEDVLQMKILSDKGYIKIKK